MDLVQVVSMLIASAVFALLTDGSSYALVFLAAGVVSLSGAGVILMSRAASLRVVTQS
jgi:hypothetical protein